MKCRKALHILYNEISLHDPGREVISINIQEKIPSQYKSLFTLIGKEASREEIAAYLVGGCVRDFLLGFPATDFDVIVEGDGVQFARSLAGKYGGKVTIHKRFGTATWLLNEDAKNKLGLSLQDFSANLVLDIITARSEIYEGAGSLPAVSGSTLKNDLKRRDFTINTLAMNLAPGNFGEIIDELSAWKDLQEGIIRILHPGSFKDDPTRMYRAIRYEQRYKFSLSTETETLISPSLGYVRNLSATRIRHELDRIMDEQNPQNVLQRLSELGLLKAVHSSLIWNNAMFKRMKLGLREAQSSKVSVSRKTLCWMFWMMGIPEKDLKEINRRLHFSNVILKNALGASSLLSHGKTIVNKKPSECVEFLDKYPKISIQAVYLALVKEPEKAIYKQYLDEWSSVKPETTGGELMNLNIPQGPVYREILLRLRNAWLDGDVRSGEDESRLLEEILEEL